MHCDGFSVRSFGLLGALLGVLAGVTACGDDSGSGGTVAVGGSTATGTASGGATSAIGVGGGIVGVGGVASPTAGGTSSVPTSVASTALVSNIPATATRDFSSTSEGTGLVLKSLNVVPDDVTAYTEWFGEVVNNGSAVICFPQVDFTFKSATGVVLWSETAYARAAPYLGALNSSIACLAPGESGGFWTNDLSTVRPTDIASVTIVFDGLLTTATKFSQVITSSIISDGIYQDGNHWAMTGTLTPSQTIYNVGIDVFTKSTAGLLTGHLIDTNLGTITANTAWTFDSLLGVEGPKPASLLTFDNFILGSSSSSFGLVEVPDLVKSPKVAARAAALRAEREATQARLDSASAAKQGSSAD